MGICWCFPRASAPAQLSEALLKQPEAPATDAPIPARIAEGSPAKPATDALESTGTPGRSSAQEVDARPSNSITKEAAEPVIETPAFASEPQEPAARSEPLEPVVPAATEQTSRSEEVLPSTPAPPAPTAEEAPASGSLLPQGSPSSASIAPEPEAPQERATAQQQGNKKNQRKRKGKKGKK
ncbi:hypothetical protein ACKKBG_A16890 [Auxenochlorella protothecoides x Auxenochlorella symbiontica]